jgi:quercetin dioxygenase-like cupin family protein
VEPQFVSLADARGFQIAEGVTARALFGEGVMLNLIDLAPNSVSPLHSHPHEQLGLILRGSMTLVVEGVEHVLAEMDAYALPGDVKHQGIAGPQGALVVDVFQPVREDYRAAAAGA